MKWKAAYAQVLVDQNSGAEADEDQQKADGAFKSLLDVKPELAISAGIGAAFDFKVFLGDNKKLYLYLKGHLVVGVGGGGGVAAEMNGSQIWEMIKFLRWSLEHSDFRFLEWIESSAFEYITLIMKISTVTTEDIEALLQENVDRLNNVWQQLTTANTKVRDVANRVINSNDLNTLLPPTKAELLSMLVEDSTPTFGFTDSYRIVANQASIMILETITRHREFVEILRRMQNNGQKGTFVKIQSNYAKLILRRLFQSEQADRTERWLRTIYS